MIAGFICLMTSEVDNLHIDLIYKGKGITKPLIVKALSKLGYIKRRELYLETLVKNDKAVCFYKKLLAERTGSGM